MISGHWAKWRENWTWGEHRSDEARTHPCLVPYALLSEGEKKYDRTTARKTLLAVIALGYRVIPPEGATPADGKLAGDAIEAKREGNNTLAPWRAHEQTPSAN